MSQNKIPYTKEEILNDYRIALESREASLLGRKEVLTGKAKFGIFGDGKEIPQLALSKMFKKGDFRSGYYRDQTIMMSIGEHTVREFFAQLYAHTDIDHDPMTGGRQMNCHFATRNLNSDGSWKVLKEQHNSAADISPTAGQMPRMTGLAYASKIYRNVKEIGENNFSNNGDEVVFGTIGNASAAEGLFFETINACAVLQVPLVMSVWDDGYGISVPNKYQMAKDNVSNALKGFEKGKNDLNGYDFYVVKAWDYLELRKTYEKAVKKARKTHTPQFIHVIEVTQPQGHSTSGSHERYKSKERLQWEKDFDGIQKMKKWILEENIAEKSELEELEKTAKEFVKNEKNAAWAAYRESIDSVKEKTISILNDAGATDFATKLKNIKTTYKKDILVSLKSALIDLRNSSSDIRQPIIDFLSELKIKYNNEYNSHVYSQSAESSLYVEEIKAEYSENSPLVDGREVVQACFDKLFERDPRVVAFGEDVGKIGDVNQGFAGLQEKYGKFRISDTGIREATIIGQGIGMAMRGLRPIAEIQYLDYILYATQIISDDLASLQYRTKGGQKAPLIIRTRGHRLEGIWHSGSPMAHVLNAVHGVRLLVPRDMTQAVGFYNTLMKSDEPAIMVESLNGYRLKEKLPNNVGEFTVPLGVPEILVEGSDITIVSYGSTLRVIKEAMEKLNQIGISAELIDVQTLLPFDRHHKILDSIKKTNRVIFIDEDMPGGTSAYMMQKVVDEQNAWEYLDSKPVALAARESRPAYASDGDYFSKPNAEDIFEKIYEMFNEYNPEKFPIFY
jgi:pyruvate/2-oxoglutarate/acetoin dehydrogenase E1 component/TPP-dependent pyruvate/acetoin dehydrogenase alpha subunit